jgi:hypothetical protein
MPGVGQVNATSTQLITRSQSLAAVQTLLRAGLSCITFLRYVVPIWRIYPLDSHNRATGTCFPRTTSRRVRYILTRISLVLSNAYIGHLTTTDDSFMPSNSASETDGTPKGPANRTRVTGMRIMVGASCRCLSYLICRLLDLDEGVYRRGRSPFELLGAHVVSVCHTGLSPKMAGLGERDIRRPAKAIFA